MAIRFSNFTRAVAFGAMLVLLTLGLVWVLSNTSPQPAIVTINTTQISESPQLVATSSPIPIPTVTFVPIHPQPSDPVTNPTPISYVVQSDDTCVIIATMFMVSVQSIATLNHLSSSCTLEIGQTLLIPQPTPTPNVNYENYRNSGIEKILAGNLEGGLLDLAQAKEIQGLDVEAQNYFDWATAYGLGMSFWDIDWEQAVYYFRQVASFEPELHDSTGLTAAYRYETALEMFISQLTNEQDWCQALRYYEKLEAFNPVKAAESAFQTTRTELISQCSIQIPPIITMDSDSDAIRQVLLDSSLNWTTIWVDAMIMRIDGAITTVARSRIWFVDPDKSREIYDFDNDNLADSFVFTNNILQTTFDLKLGTETTQILDGLPQPPLNILNPGPAFALRGGTFWPLEHTIVANRETLIVEWRDEIGQPKDRLYIDIYTGVVLKWENLREGYMGETDGQEYLMDAEIEVLDVTYDVTFPDDLFTPHVSGEPEYMEAPEVLTDRTPIFVPTPGNPDTSLQYGEIYLLSQGEQAHMLYFPASCLITGRPCPQPEFVSDVPVGTIYPPYAWSPNHNQMAINGSASYVLLFNRDSQDWTQFYYAPYFNFPVWSPDGQWLFGMPEHQISDPLDPLLLVSADGRQWEEIMTDQPGTKYPLGWLDKDHILIQNSLDSQKTEEDGSLYDEIQVYNLQTGEVTVIKGIQRDDNIFTLTLPTLSPDRTQLAYTMINTLDGSAEVTVIQLEDGTETSFAFSPGIASWSPDSNWLSLQTFKDNICEIHLVRPDGTDAYKVFSGTGCNFTWSPGGQYILIPTLAKIGTVPRLYIISTTTGESRLIELPDVGMEFWWPAASWVP